MKYTNTELQKYVGMRVKLIVPRDKYTDTEVDNLFFNDDMIKALKEDPYVDILKVMAWWVDGTIWRLRARFSDGQTWSVVPKRFDKWPCLFL